MTDPVTGTAAASGWYTPPASTTSPSGTDAMGSDTFLKLLVAQLKYQDPSNPADGTQFLAQTAQFQMVEKLQELATQNTQLMDDQRTLGSIGLIGRSVTYTDGDNDHNGTVSGVRITPSGPVLTVDGTDVPLTAVNAVQAATAQPAAPATPPVTTPPATDPTTPTTQP